MSLDGTAAQHGEERRVASAAQRDPSQQEVVPRMREFDHGGGVRMKTGMEGRWGEVVTWAYPTRRAGEGTIELLSLGRIRRSTHRRNGPDCSDRVCFSPWRRREYYRSE